jgi:hypothetical protein
MAYQRRDHPLFADPRPILRSEPAIPLDFTRATLAGSPMSTVDPLPSFASRRFEATAYNLMGAVIFFDQQFLLNPS